MSAFFNSDLVNVQFGSTASTAGVRSQHCSIASLSSDQRCFREKMYNYVDSSAHMHMPLDKLSDSWFSPNIPCVACIPAPALSNRPVSQSLNPSIFHDQLWHAHCPLLQPESGFLLDLFDHGDTSVDSAYVPPSSPLTTIGVSVSLRATSVAPHTPRHEKLAPKPSNSDHRLVSKSAAEVSSSWHGSGSGGHCTSSSPNEELSCSALSVPYQFPVNVDSLSTLFTAIDNCNAGVMITDRDPAPVFSQKPPQGSAFSFNDAPLVDSTKLARMACENLINIAPAAATRSEGANSGTRVGDNFSFVIPPFSVSTSIATSTPRCNVSTPDAASFEFSSYWVPQIDNCACDTDSSNETGEPHMFVDANGMACTQVSAPHTLHTKTISGRRLKSGKPQHRKHVCPTCFKTFTRRSNLVAHIRYQ